MGLLMSMRTFSNALNYHLFNDIVTLKNMWANRWLYETRRGLLFIYFFVSNINWQTRKLSFDISRSENIVRMHFLWNSWTIKFQLQCLTFEKYYVQLFLMQQKKTALFSCWFRMHWVTHTNDSKQKLSNVEEWREKLRWQ